MADRNGDNDRMVPSMLSDVMHRRIPGSKLVIYADSGHGGIFQFHGRGVRAVSGKGAIRPCRFPATIGAPSSSSRDHWH